MADRALEGRRILLGITGSIAAYKAPGLVRLFKQAGAHVRVIMTPTAARFVTAESLATVSGERVLSDMFASHDTWTEHVALGQWADVMVLAPLSAQTLAKVVHGFADNLLTAVSLAARCPVLLCPAMDHDMYVHAAVRDNLDRARAYGYHVMEAEHGELASGLVGQGRLPARSAIVERTADVLQERASLQGKTALVTAGPTREPIDAVRVVTNYSTGSMGFALAAALSDRGAAVTLVSGPTLLQAPSRVARIDVETAEDMYQAVMAQPQPDYVFMAAAVADYRAPRPAKNKIKKSQEEKTIALTPTRDILKELGRQKPNGQVLVGFAMETDDGVPNALHKLRSKNLDWIVLNNVHEPGAGFGTGTNKVTLLGADGTRVEMGPSPKRAVADALIDRITGT